MGGLGSPLDRETCYRAGALRRASALSMARRSSRGGSEDLAIDHEPMPPLGVKAYGIGRLPGTPEERRQGHWAHGANERRPLRWIPEYVRYVRGVVLEVAR